MKSLTCGLSACLAVLSVVAVFVTSPLLAAEQTVEHSPVNTSPPGSELGALQVENPGSFMVQVSGNSLRPNCTPVPCSECLYLDLYDPSHSTTAPVGSPWVLGPVTSTYYLTSGKWYLITISGDVSYWAQDTSNSPNWTSNPATWTGTPGNPPRYPSPGATNGYTGFDWEYVFAIPYAKTYPPPDSSFPHHLLQGGISVNGPGGPFMDLSPIGGQSYHPDHMYKYLVQGMGNRASFESTDTGPTSDNSGRYKICIQVVCGDDGGVASNTN